MVEISVFIPVYRESKLTFSLLERLIHQKVNKEIYVVVDEPTRKFLDALKKFEGSVRFIINGKRVGKAEALNRAVESSSGEILLFLDSDVELPDNPDFLKKIIERALEKIKRQMEPNALDFLMESADGDARVAINVIEIADSIDKQSSSKSSRSKRKITLDVVEQALQRKQFTFDKKGEEYYNVISAYIKSMRASNVDAALYYLARMVKAGQDPLYIARRMVVFASEDVASPTALVVANAVFRACETIGYPECQENLAAGTVYLAKAKKDRSAYDAYLKALEDVNRYGNLPTPKNLRNPVTKLMKDLDYGKDYEMYTEESLLPDQLRNKKYFSQEPEIGEKNED